MNPRNPHFHSCNCANLSPDLPFWKWVVISLSTECLQLHGVFQWNTWYVGTVGLKCRSNFDIAKISNLVFVL